MSAKPDRTRHTYANANYIVQAAIVEAALGIYYESYLREHLAAFAHGPHGLQRAISLSMGRLQKVYLVLLEGHPQKEARRRPWRKTSQPGTEAYLGAFAII